MQRLSDGTETSVFKEENEEPYDELRVDVGERRGGGGLDHIRP